ncbi:hypothetical protein F5Y09DRAFT_197824 [Xylaria sp. FL1042]|nr:hypothetical protein F5Y09DRAFT_197824 [Xylaria sp. FL1042]
MSSPSSSKPYSLQLAERIHYATGKEDLWRICAGGFLLESVWLSVIERRVLKTSTPNVRKAMIHAAVRWPVIYVVTSTSITWAAWKVNQAQAERCQSERD